MTEGAVARLSRDGRTASFFSDATNLDDGDANGATDALARVGPTPSIQSATGGTLPRGAVHAHVTLHGAELFDPFFVAVTGGGITVHSATVGATHDQVVLDVSVAADAATGTRTVIVANVAAVGHAGTGCACIAVT
jgi:hypothetical protein